MGCGESKPGEKKQHLNQGKKQNKQGVKASTQQAQSNLQAKICLVGESTVGKSSFLERYTSDKYSEGGLPPTVGAQYVQDTITLKNKQNMQMHIWDTAGQEKFRSLNGLFYKESQGCLLMYDITNKETFKNVQFWIEQVKNNISADNYVFVLVGNKSDLEEERQVTEQEGKNLQRSLGLNRFFEASAKEDENVKESFKALAEEIALVKGIGQDD